MKKLLVLLMALFTLAQVDAQEKNVIRIATDNTDLILQVAPNGRLYQAYLGDKLLNEKDINNFSPYVKGGSDGSVSTRGWEVYPGSGAEDYFEPAIAITHNDGNPSTILRYISSEQKAVAGGTETIIQLKDNQYPVEVTLHYMAYPKENVIKTWSEIKHQEKKPVLLSTYASAMLYFNNSAYYLTEFSSDWAKEAQMSSQQLQFGKKVIDTKLGSRAAMHTHPFFEVGLDQPVSEHQGNVLMGTLGWTGNFRFTFEVDNVGNLRVIPGINPYASNYELKPNEVFTTPEFIFTLSNDGAGKGSRNLHEWARNYSLKDGKGSRLTLLNNWENTGFNFNQEILAELMKEAKHLGVDMFLLDDGWFANKYPRKNDHAGLGDWDVNHDKLPGGIPALVKAAKDADVKFGIWIEPEMVNPKSELFEKHPDWAITLPNRETYYTEFWCSDNTDPIERLFIQWGFSQIFPAKAMCAHVTSWNKNTSVKFRTDVASMCKLGFDLGLKELNADEQTYCQNAVANWTRLKKVILDGDQYRLVSPYDGNHMSLMYASPDKNKAVLYTYDIHPRFGEKLLPVKLQGLDAKKMYKVKEINLMPNSKSNLAANEKTYSGDYLMKVGINAFTTNQAFSRVIELTAE